MNAQTVGQIIQFILAPVVMISSCSVFASGLLSRYALINERLRLMSRERLDLLRARKGANDPLIDERVSEIDQQIPDLLQRHKQTHDALVLAYCSIFLFTCDMFAIALLVISEIGWLSSVVLVLFLGGVLALMISIVVAVLEVYRSHRSVHYEIARVASLGAEGV